MFFSLGLVLCRNKINRMYLMYLYLSVGFIKMVYYLGALLEWRWVVSSTIAICKLQRKEANRRSFQDFGYLSIPYPGWEDNKTSEGFMVLSPFTICFPLRLLYIWVSCWEVLQTLKKCLPLQLFLSRNTLTNTPRNMTSGRL